MKVLMLVSSCPDLFITGTAQRTNLLYRALSKLGSVHMVIAGDFPVDSTVRNSLYSDFNCQGIYIREKVQFTSFWRALGLSDSAWPMRFAKLRYGAALEFRRDLHAADSISLLHQKQGYDLIVSRYLQPLGVTRPFGMAPVIVDVDDLPSEVAKSRMRQMSPRGLRQWYWSNWLRSMQRAEHELMNQCVHAWVTKEEDADLCRACPTTILRNIPYNSITTSIRSDPLPNLESRTILVVGTLAHIPNVLGIDRFLEKSWSQILACIPNARFRIVGKGLTAEMRDRWSAYRGIQVVGFVEDLKVEYQSCAFAICPVWEGGGTCIKVLEALSHGRTVVCSPFGARGYLNVLRNDESLLIAEDDAMFASHCVSLLRNPVRAASLASTGAAYVTANYTFASFSRAVAEGVGRAFESYRSGHAQLPCIRA